VRRNGKKHTEIVYLISRLTLAQLNAAGVLKLKRGDWVIESRLHHSLDVVWDEDRSRLRTPNSAWVLGRFRRLTVSLALAWVVQKRQDHPQSRASVRGFPKTFHRRDGGPQRLRSLIFSKSPGSWRFAKCKVASYAHAKKIAKLQIITAGFDISMASR
jgi:hypothetical protein